MPGGRRCGQGTIYMRIRWVPITRERVTPTRSLWYPHFYTRLIHEHLLISSPLFAPLHLLFLLPHHHHHRLLLLLAFSLSFDLLVCNQRNDDEEQTTLREIHSNERCPLDLCRRLSSVRWKRKSIRIEGGQTVLRPGSDEELVHTPIFCRLCYYSWNGAAARGNSVVVLRVRRVPAGCSSLKAQSLVSVERQLLSRLKNNNSGEKEWFNNYSQFCHCLQRWTLTYWHRSSFRFETDFKYLLSSLSWRYL